MSIPTQPIVIEPMMNRPTFRNKTFGLGLLCPFLLVPLGVAMSGCSPLRTGSFNLSGPKERSMESQLALAMLSEKHSDTERAEELYQNLLIRDPSNVDSRRRLAIIASRKEDFEEANRLFSECVELEPDNAELRNDFGYSCYMSDDLRNAEKHLKAAIELQRNFPAAWTNLGLVYAQQARFQDCRDAFSRAAESTVEVHCNMGYVYAQSMQLEEAKNEFTSALSLDPNCTVAAEGLLQVCKQLPGSEPKTIVSTFAVSKPTQAVEKKDAPSDSVNTFELQRPTPGTVPLDKAGNMSNSSSPPSKN
jgi:Tfp pilus assembly protein PilF